MTFTLIYLSYFCSGLVLNGLFASLPSTRVYLNQGFNERFIEEGLTPTTRDEVMYLLGNIIGLLITSAVAGPFLIIRKMVSHIV